MADDVLAPQSVDDWLDEIEGFSTRRERFTEAAHEGHAGVMLTWMEAAFKAGAESALPAGGEGMREALGIVQEMITEATREMDAAPKTVRTSWLNYRATLENVASRLEGRAALTTGTGERGK